MLSLLSELSSKAVDGFEVVDVLAVVVEITIDENVVEMVSVEVEGWVEGVSVVVLVEEDDEVETSVVVEGASDDDSVEVESDVGVST